MDAINRSLKQQFESQYPDTIVELESQGTDEALQAVLNGTIDLAAIGRPLTDEERGQGLIESPVSREKIAIILGADNPFQGNLTFEQFAKIFRGEITDWSALGGSPGPIRVVDHPELSDTRKALSAYSVFKVAPFQTGATATQVAADDATEIINQLGQDGISYIVAGQVLNRNDVRIVPMHDTLPDDPRYPYSQPRNYVYKDVTSPAVQSFLGFATSPGGQQAIANAGTEVAVPPGAASNSSPLPTAGATSGSVTPVPGATSPSPDVAGGLASPSGEAAVSGAGAGASGATPSPQASTSDAGAGWLPWLLLPLVGIGGLLLWGASRRGDNVASSEAINEIHPSVPPGTPSGTTLADRTGSVIAADRSVLPERGPVPSELPQPDLPDVEPPVVPPITEPEVLAPAAALPSVPPLGVAGGLVAAGVGAAAIAGLWRDRRSRIVLTPRTPQQGYAYWEVPENEKAALRQQGGEKLTLKISDVTGLQASEQPHQVQQYDCDESDFDRFVPLPQTDRDYVAEIGYLTSDAQWLPLAISEPVHVAAPAIAALPDPRVEPGTAIQEEPTFLQEPVTELQAEPAIPPVETTAIQEEPTFVQEAVTELQEEPTVLQPETTIQDEPVDLTLIRNLSIAGGAVAAGATLFASGAAEPSETEAELEETEPVEVEPAAGEDSLLAEAISEPASVPIITEVSEIERSVETSLSSDEPDIEEIATETDETLLIYGTIDEPIVSSAASIENIWGGEENTIVEASLDSEAIVPEPAEVDAVSDIENAEPPSVESPEIQEEPAAEPSLGTANLTIAGGAVLAGAAMFSTEPVSEEERAQSAVEATKFDVGQVDLSSESLASVDEGLPDLADGYGESWITLLPRDPQWAYAYWDVPDDHKQILRQQGGQRLALRFYDVTAIDLGHQNPHSLQQYECDEMARDWYIPVPISDRDYIVEIGYVADDGRWLMLARSNAVRIPPLYPTDWYEDQFITVDWDEALGGKNFVELSPSGQERSVGHPLSDRIFSLSESAEAQRVAGSIFGSMQQVSPEAVSSFALGSGAGLAAKTESGIGMSGAGMSGIGMSGAGMSGAGMSGIGMYSQFGVAGMSGVGMSGVGLYSQSGMGMMSGVGMSVPTLSGIGLYSQSGMGMMSGIGMLSVPTMSGIGMSGIGMSVPTMSGVGMFGAGMSGAGMSGIGMYSQSGAGMYSMSGVGMMSGIGMMSGVGFSASMPPMRSRKFWLIADAELIIYGATEPDATVTIAGRPVQLNPDGTFRFHLSFQDGTIDFPILAIAADGEQSRSIHMTFTRETPSRNTNTADEARDELF